MLEIASVILGVISIAQGYNNKVTEEEKRAELARFLVDMSIIHDFLDETKAYHDAYETKQKVAISVLRNGISKNIDSLIEANNLIEQFLSADRAISGPAQLKYSVVDRSGLEDFPALIRNQMSIIVSAYTDLGQAASQYTKLIGDLRALVEEQNFGNRLKKTITAIDDQCSRAVTSADITILNIVPVLRFFHHESVRMVQSL